MTPKLRFPEFTDEWQPALLEDIASFSKGASISKDDISPKGATLAIRYGELYTTYSEVIDTVKSSTNLPVDSLVLSKQNDVIIPASGETHIDIATASCVLRDGIALSGDINIIRSNQNGVFLAYYLNKKRIDIARRAQGVSVIHLYSANLKDLSLNLPSIPEQQKIADLLMTVDKKIETIDKKVELLKQYKKGVMQKIFSQQIRFKDENENDYPDWNKKSLGEILEYEQPTKYIVRSTDYDESFKTPVLTAGKSFILGYTDETDNVYDNVPVIIFDDFTTASQFVDFPFKVKSSAMKILRARPGVNIKIAYELLRQVEYSAEDHKRHWIGEFQQFSVNVPCEGEQRKIADFLTSIDAKIKVEEIKLDSVKRFKKALLQRMFV